MRIAVAASALLCLLFAACESDPTQPSVAAKDLRDGSPLLAAAPTQSAADAISANIHLRDDIRHARPLTM